jgi:hypothetical protein
LPLTAHWLVTNTTQIFPNLKASMLFVHEILLDCFLQEDYVNSMISAVIFDVVA